MKKFFYLFFILFSHSILSQTINEAVDFLKVKYPEWTCFKYAKGTLIPKISISISDDGKFLRFKSKFPSHFKAYAFMETEIDLSMVIQIEAQYPDNGCARINIITKPYGMWTYNLNSESKRISTKDDTFFKQFGWKDDSLYIIEDENFETKCDRIIKALKFLVAENSGKLKDSHF
tara:strand:+ start:427 stop:951 length:525 start_codon:yes stop_codon:yes gene_type:complete